MRWLASLARDECGQALVEFAIVVPLFLILMFGIIDFGQALNYWNDETNMANVAARYAVVLPASSSNSYPACSLSGVAATNLTTYVQCMASNSYSLSGLSVCVKDLTNPTVPSPFQAQDQIEVEIKYSDHVPVLGPLTPWTVPFNLSSSATMMMEQTPTNTDLAWLTGATQCTS